MQKVVNPALRREAESESDWLDPEAVARIEVTSEHPDFPVESVLTTAGDAGWRAAGPGKQTVRIMFDQLRSLHRIRLEFSETERERTQEFTLRAAANPDGPFREIVRQQWNFSPRGATREVEDYRVDLFNILVLELTLKPDLGRNQATATLDLWQMA